MKKFRSLLLLLALALSLTACTQPSSQSTPPASNDPVTPTQSEPVTSAPISGGDELPAFQTTATIEETVLYQENDVCITATGLNYGDYSVEVSLLIENNSEKDLGFVSNSVGYSCNSVNGYMIEDGYLNCDVHAGKKANDTIEISYSTLMLYGIFEIADIELGFDISDDDYNHIYSGPCQITTSAADGFEYDTASYRKTISSSAAQNYFGYTIPYFSDEVLHEQDGFSVLSSGLMVNESGETALLLEVSNTSSQAANVTTSEIYLNGLGVYSSNWSSSTVNPGKTSILYINLSALMDDNFWDVYGLQDISTVSLSMGFVDADGNDLSAPTTLTISAPDTSPSFSQDGQEVYNANDIRIITKGIVEDSSEYSNDMYILLLVENNTADTISINEVYDSFSVNGYMMDCIVSTVTVNSGTCAVLDILLWESDLEENSISDVSDISEFEVTFEIEAGNRTIDEAALQVTL